MNEAVQRSLAQYAKDPNAMAGSRRRKSPQGAAFISGSINISWSTGMTFQFCEEELTYRSVSIVKVCRNGKQLIG
jgi:hypothetical protein